MKVCPLFLIDWGTTDYLLVDMLSSARKTWMSAHPGTNVPAASYRPLHESEDPLSFENVQRSDHLYNRSGSTDAAVSTCSRTSVGVMRFQLFFCSIFRILPLSLLFILPFIRYCLHEWEDSSIARHVLERHCELFENIGSAQPAY